jgi:hypothetical protein
MGDILAINPWEWMGVFKTRNAEYGIRNTEYGISKMAARDEAVSSFCTRRCMYLEYVICTYFSAPLR